MRTLSLLFIAMTLSSACGDDTTPPTLESLAERPQDACDILVDQCGFSAEKYADCRDECARGGPSAGKPSAMNVKSASSFVSTTWRVAYRGSRASAPTWVTRAMSASGLMRRASDRAVTSSRGVEAADAISRMCQWS